MDFEKLKEKIDNTIYENIDGDIGGANLNEVLNDMVDKMEEIETTPGPQGPQGPQGERGPQGPVGQDAVNPFKGWYDSDDDLPESPLVGDFAYVMDASPATSVSIYKCSTAGIWTDSGDDVDTSLVQTFRTGQSINLTGIDNDLVNSLSGDVAGAETAMLLKSKLANVDLTETKVEVSTEGSTPNVIDEYYVNGNTGEPTHPTSSSDYQYYSYLLTDLPEGALRVRFLAGGNKSASYNTGYAFGKYVEGIWTPLSMGTFPASDDPSEIIVEVPDGATHFMTTCKAKSTVTAITIAQFYCYVQGGYPALGHNDIANDFDGGVEKVLSAEKGRELYLNLSEKNVVSPVKYAKQNFAAVEIGDTLNESNFTGSNSSAVRVFDVQGGVDYYLYGGLDKNAGGYWLYFWTDENDVVLDRIYSTVLPTDKTTQSYRFWEGYKATAPEGAVKLYEKCYNAAPDANFHIDYYSFKQEQSTWMRILAIGNSYSQDSLAYVPFIMRAISPNIKMQIGILHQDSASIEDHYNNFIWARDEDTDHNKGENYRFFLYDSSGTNAWVDFGSSQDNKKSIQWALDNYDWDLVLMNNTRMESGNPPEKYIPLENLISAYVGYAIKFGGIMTINHPSSHNGGTPSNPNTGSSIYFIGEEELDARFDQSCATNRNEIEKTLCDFVLPVATAVMNAYTVETIKSIGSYANHPNNSSGMGYLCYFDGFHLQDGLPCQLAAYTVIIGLLALYGKSYQSVLGDRTKCDSAFLSGKNVPGPHGTATGFDEGYENIHFIQRCAVMATKNPWVVTDMNSFVDTIE